METETSISNTQHSILTAGLLITAANILPLIKDFSSLIQNCGSETGDF